MSVPGPAVEIDLQRSAGSLLLRVAGELDLASERKFEDCMTQLWTESPAELVLDLREVTFIDSTGLRLVLEMWHVSQRDGFDLAILVASGPVQRAFELTGLDRALPTINGIPGPEGNSKPAD